MVCWAKCQNIPLFPGSGVVVVVNDWCIRLEMNVSTMGKNVPLLTRGCMQGDLWGGQFLPQGNNNNLDTV